MNNALSWTQSSFVNVFIFSPDEQFNTKHPILIDNIKVYGVIFGAILSINELLHVLSMGLLRLLFD